jgi:membrane protein implicated in regulation of membrane protease activity
MHIAWWYWISLGLFLLLVEALTPGGFYLLFIGIAALVVGILALAVDVSWIQISLFGVLSAVLITTLRKPMVERLRKSTTQADTPEFIGESARAVEMIKAGREGKIELRGSIWNARNSGTEDLAENAACTIISRDGIRMVVTLKQ